MQQARIESVPARWSFGKLPTEIIENPNLTTHEKLLIGCLLWHGPGQVFPGRERLASLMSCSPCQVTRAIKGLESKGIIRVYRQKGGVNVYDMGGGVGADSVGGRRSQRLPVGADSDTNESNLNESKEQEKNTAVAVPSAPPPPKRPNPRPNATIWAMVAKWETTYRNHCGFESLEGKGKCYDIIAETVRTWGQDVTDAILGEYWGYWKRLNLKRGGIFDFKAKRNMLHNIVLENRAKYRRE